MVQANNLYKMVPITQSDSPDARYLVPEAKGCHYRGWTLVERCDGIYMTRDNLHYTLVQRSKGYASKTFTRFHQMADERESAA